MLHRLMAVAAVLAVAIMSATVARADDAARGMQSGDLSRLESALRDATYTSWEEIVREDGGFEIDDARGLEGRERDLWVDGTIFEIREN